VLLEGLEGVGRRVMDVQITQRQSGKGAGGKNNVQWDRAGVVGATLGTVGVDYRDACGGGVEKTVRGEEVQSHNVTPSEETGQEGNRSQKGTINVRSNPWLAATGCRRGKNSKQIKRGEFASINRRVLEGNNGRRVGQLLERPEQRKKHIPAPEAVVLNECERVLLAAPKCMVVLH